VAHFDIHVCKVNRYPTTLISSAPGTTSGSCCSTIIARLHDQQRLRKLFCCRHELDYLEYVAQLRASGTRCRLLLSCCGSLVAMTKLLLLLSAEYSLRYVHITMTYCPHRCCEPSKHLGALLSSTKMPESRRHSAQWPGNYYCFLLLSAAVMPQQLCHTAKMWSVRAGSNQYAGKINSGTCLADCSSTEGCHMHA
jgi:hypothetical protein